MKMTYRWWTGYEYKYSLYSLLFIYGVFIDFTKEIGKFFIFLQQAAIKKGPKDTI